MSNPRESVGGTPCLCVYIKIKCAQTTSTSSATGRSLITPTLLQTQRNGVALSVLAGAGGRHREIILRQQEQGKAFFGGGKKKNERPPSLLPQGRLINHPVTSSSSHMPKARCLSLQGDTPVPPARSRRKSCKASKGMGGAGGLRLRQAMSSKAGAPSKPRCHLQTQCCTSQREAEKRPKRVRRLQHGARSSGQFISWAAGSCGRAPAGKAESPAVSSGAHQA